MDYNVILRKSKAQNSQLSFLSVEESGGGEWVEEGEDDGRSLGWIYVLITVFGYLDTVDLVAGVSLTCSSWRSASKHPTFWKNLDFSGWDRRYVLPNQAFSDILRVAVDRGDGSLETIRFPHFADALHLLHISQRCPKLRYFYMENGEISANVFSEATGKFEFLKGMTIHENLICEQVLEQVAKSSTYLTDLKIIGESVDLFAALVIRKHFPNLKKLELNDCEISKWALLMFLDDFKDLEYLDISGRSLGVTSIILQKASRLKVFLWGSEFWDSEIEHAKLDLRPEQQ